MAWKKLISYFSNVVTASPFFLLTSKQQSEPAHAAVTQKLWWQGCVETWACGQWEWAARAQHGLTCPDRRQDRGSSWAPREFNGILWLLVGLTRSRTVSSPGALGNHSQGEESIKVTHKFSGLESQR